MYRRKICLEALVKVAGAGRLLLRGRCGLAEAVLAFFVEHPTKELEKTVAQAVEAIRAQASRRVCDDAGVKARKASAVDLPHKLRRITWDHGARALVVQTLVPAPDNEWAPPPPPN